MARRSSDFDLIVWIIAIPIVLIGWIIQLIGRIIIYFSNKYLNKKNKERLEQTQLKNKLENKIGIETANCPYCGIDLPKFPQRKTKCKNCDNFIYVRTRPSDKKKILLTEDEINRIEYNSASGLVIDATKEMNAVISYFRENYNKFCNYEEILSIPESDRLPILEFIWSRWAYHDVSKELIKQYPNYDKDDLIYIYRKENARLYEYEKWVENKKNFGNDVLMKVKSDIDWRARFCDIKDVMNIFNETYDEDSMIYFSPVFSLFPDELQTEYVYFYENGEYIKMLPKEFKKFCKKNKYEYPFNK